MKNNKHRLHAFLAVSAAFAATVALRPALAAEAYVSNQNGDISVIDTDTLQIKRTIDAYGEEPRGIGVTADGKLLVVANREGGRISVIDRQSGKLLKHVHVGANPEFVRVRGHMAFVSYEPSSTGKPPPRGASAAAAAEHDDDDKNAEPAHIAIVDLDAGKVVRSIKGGPETEGIEFAADGKHILVTNEADDTVTVHDIATGKLTHTTDLAPYGKRPRGVKIAPSGDYYVVTLEFSNEFAVLDGNYKVIKTVKTGESPYGLAFSRDGDRLYVAASKSKLLQVFDTKTWKPIKEVETGRRCWHFSFTPDNKTILLACGRSNEVIAIDAGTLEVKKRIPDAKLPWGVVTYPKSIGSLDQPE